MAPETARETLNLDSPCTYGGHSPGSPVTEQPMPSSLHVGAQIPQSEGEERKGWPTDM